MAAPVKQAALNPAFLWEGGGVEPVAAPSQAPWDFSGAAAEVEREHRARRTTTVDDKIKAALRAKGGAVAGRGAKAAPEVLVGEKRGRKRAEQPAPPVPADVSDDDESSGDDELEAEREGAGGELGEPLWEGGLEESSDEEADPYADARAGKAAAKAAVALQHAGGHAPGKAKAEGGTVPAVLEDTFITRRAAEPAAPKAKGPAVAVQPTAESWGVAAERSGRAKPETAASFDADSFAELGLSRPLLRACAALGYTRPTPIQAAVVPLGLTGRDICGRAVTGSGKTAAFMLPMLERLLHRARGSAATRCLVVTPTRELAVQIAQMGERLAQFTDVRIALVVGGLSLAVQAAALRARPEVVVATPGRLIDHLRNTPSFSLDDLAALVLDEADRLLELGFTEELKELLRLCPKRRQTLLFSATLTPEVETLAALSLQQPARLSADGMGAAPASLTQEIVRVRPGSAGDKEAIVMALLARTFAGQRVIVFARTKARAHRLKVLAGLCDMTTAELHGDMTQAQRLASLELFRTGGAQVLIATDVAARGLDIAAVAAVISLDAPRDVPSYLHRCGRTARAGASGTAVTLAEEKDRPLLKALAAATKPAKGEPPRPKAQLLRERQVDPAAVAVWRARLEGLADAVAHVGTLEAEEAMGRRADMEASKAEHMLEHADEIAARPARSWFQSERDKERVVKTAKAAAMAIGVPAPKLKERKRKGDPPAEGRGKKAKQEEGPAAAELDGKAKPQDDAAAARRGAAMAKGAAKRALVAGARPKAAADAAKAAMQKDMLARRKLMRRTEQGSGAERPAKSAGPGGLFAGDGINGARPGVGDRGKDDRHLREAKAGLAARLAARAERPQRGGDKLKRSGFKSKARYKRK